MAYPVLQAYGDALGGKWLGYLSPIRRLWRRGRGVER
jgi:hypothetical protein